MNARRGRTTQPRQERPDIGNPDRAPLQLSSQEKRPPQLQPLGVRTHRVRRTTAEPQVFEECLDGFDSQPGSVDHRPRPPPTVQLDRLNVHRYSDRHRQMPP
jgi:hypothetical protein